MNMEVVKGILNLNIDMVSTLTIAVLLLILGYYIRNNMKFFDRFCIPAPVIGGLIFSIMNLIIKQSTGLNINMDTTFQSPFMIVFFTTVGLGGSLSLVKKGGIPLIIYWFLCGGMAVLQNIIGVSVAKLVGIHPLLGVMAGAVSMEGGHGAAAAFGPTVEEMGVAGAKTVALASATFGLIAGGLLGGPVAKSLIDKNNLKPTMESDFYSKQVEAENCSSSEITSHSVIVQIAVITLCMTVGSILSDWFTNKTGQVLPGYVGAMLVAVIFRNINDNLGLIKIDFKIVNLIGDISLGIFLSMALMTLELWELKDLGGPMLVILLVQVIFMVFYAGFLAFRLLGKDFDAAIISAGLIGHGLGATPNAVANMSSVTEKYGPSPKAFLVVPLVGAFLIDIFAIPSIVWFINFFK